MKKLILFIRRKLFAGTMHSFANVAVGTHPGRLTRTLAAAVSERYTLVKSGSALNTVEPCQAGDQPLGIATDTGTTGESINVNLPGTGAQTQLLVAASAIFEGDLVYVANGGRVQRLPNTAGTFFEVGVALGSAASAGELVEVATHAPLRAINVAAFEGNTANDLGKLAAALELRPDKIRLLTV